MECGALKSTTTVLVLGLVLVLVLILILLLLLLLGGWGGAKKEGCVFEISKTHIRKSTWAGVVLWAGAVPRTGSHSKGAGSFQGHRVIPRAQDCGVGTVGAVLGAAGAVGAV